MAYSFILFNIGDDGIAVVTVNRPQKLNALNAGVIAELDDAIGQVETDGAIRGLILTGAGEKAFVAGADIGELAALSPVQAQTASARGQGVFRRLESLPKPTLAAINGFALGGGLELAMSCTLRVASETARMGQPEVKLGITAGYGGTQRLPRLVGRGKAMELLLTGGQIDAAEAHRIGLVNYVVAAGELMPFSRNLLGRILENAPAAVSLSMQAVDVGLNAGMDQGLRFEAAAFGLVASTEDSREGLAAFLAKRGPAFTGK
ncbi:MAG: enoyl-CoA hydratase-related protein [Acidobacteria bacterium]|nr:enoyl-CoA hydratase-related protein [Acidobacteriota bacterium]